MKNSNEFERALRCHGVRRRDFLTFCAGLAGMLALPASAAGEIAKALAKKKKPILVWLEFQDCAGNTESFLRASRPTTAEVVLDLISVDYHETIMAAAGAQAEQALQGVLKEHAGQYLAVVEGSIPTGAGGAYCFIGGKPATQIAREVCGNAAATIAIGTCAAFGGLPAARPNPTGAMSVGDAVPGLRNLINLPACPANAENLTALIAHYLTFQRWPALDGHRRPLFAYGKTIHDNCERRAHFDGAQYVEAWGDEGHRAGYCLYKMGCKGPVTYQNCPVVRWNEGTSWPIGCGHPCVGCAEPDFWDKMTPFYSHLAPIPGVPRAFGESIDRAGVILTAGTAGAFALHGLVALGRRKLFGLGPRGGKKPEPAAKTDEKGGAQ